MKQPEHAYCYLPRPEMGVGPWAEEPDHLQFEHAGMPCLLVRHPRLGVWCGYAGVSPGHPLHGLRHVGAEYRLTPELEGAPAYYGINYSAPCDPGGLICHEPIPGEPEPVWWFGMDFGHCFDLAPAMQFWERSRGFAPTPDETYRDLEFARGSVRELAAWLAARGGVS